MFYLLESGCQESREDNWTREREGNFVLTRLTLSLLRGNFMNSLGKDKASSSTRPLILQIPLKSLQYIHGPMYVLTLKTKRYLPEFTAMTLIWATWATILKLEVTGHKSKQIIETHFYMAIVRVYFWIKVIWITSDYVFAHSKCACWCVALLQKNSLMGVMGSIECFRNES